MKYPYDRVLTGLFSTFRNTINKVIGNIESDVIETNKRITDIDGEVNTRMDEIEKGVEDVNNKSIHFDGVDAELAEHAELIEQLKSSSIDGEVIAARNGFPSLLDFLKSLNPGATIATKIFTATAGQTDIDLTDTGEIQSVGKVIMFLIDGAPQYDSYEWVSSTKLRMKSPFSGGSNGQDPEKVVIRYFVGNVSIRTGHNRGHEKGGFDELDAYKLKNGDTIKNNIGTLSDLDWLPSSLSKAIKDLYDWTKNKGVNLKQPPYNMKLDGSTDETTIFQQVLNDGHKYINLPKGILRLTDTVTLPQPVVMLGNDYTNLNTDPNVLSQIWFDNNTANKKMFTSSRANSKFVNVGFRGNSFSSDRRTLSVAFEFKPENPFGDTDITFENCKFYRFSTSIDFTGRGLTLRGNTFVEQWQPIILKHFNNDETVNVPSADHQTNIRGFREFQFTANRFHSIQGHVFVCESTSVNNYEKYIHQVVVTGNLFDGTGGIWRGYIGGGELTGNTLGKSGGNVYDEGTKDVFDLAGAQNFTIVGNTFGGEFDLSTVMSREIYFGNLLNLRAGGTFKNLKCDENTIVGCGKKLINCMAAFTRLSFVDNIVDGVLMSTLTTTETAFYFDLSGKFLKIKDNMVGNTKSVKHDYLVKFNTSNRGTTLFDITGNIFDSAEFGISHNLYPYNATGNIESTNYTGDGVAGGKTLTFTKPVIAVFVYDSTGSVKIKRVGTTNGDTFISVTDNIVTVKDVCNTNGTTYSIIAICV